MSEGKILARIEKKQKERRRVWSAGGDPVSSERIERDLTQLYEELRLARARKRNGDRRTIARRARVERELEKLGA